MKQSLLSREGHILKALGKSICEYINYLNAFDIYIKEKIDTVANKPIYFR